MKLTIIGAGNIGGATAVGLARSAAPDLEITVTARHASTLEKFAPSRAAEGGGAALAENGALRIRTSLDNRAAVRGADIVVLAVKPWQMEEVVLDLLPALDLERQTIVSMAPGVGSDLFRKWLGESAFLAYVIPNTAIAAGQSMTFIAPVGTMPEERIEALKELFEYGGSCLVVEESMLRAGTSLASCGIAYALRYISAAAKGGVALGFRPEESLEAVRQTVRGALAILEANSSLPEDEIDRVTTPGGMTLKGLEAMEAGGFSAAVISGLEANKS